MDTSIVVPKPKTRNTKADLVQPSLLSLLPEVPPEVLPEVRQTAVESKRWLVAQAPNDRRQSLKRYQCPDGMGYCSRCDTYKDVSEFRKDKYSATKLCSYCKECGKSYNDRHQENRVHKRRASSYGITPEQYRALHTAQGGVCAICGELETRTNKGVKVDLSVDHDHATGRVRGLLCAACNVAIGFFREKPESLENAIRYLKDNSRPVIT